VYCLYLITDGSRPERIAGDVAAALRGAPPASVLVQLRAKSCAPQQLYEIARQVQEQCARYGAGFVVNDRADLAQAVKADGVHLPERALPPDVVRHILGPRALIGVSCHDAAGLDSAAESGASFATLSPVFPSPNKGAPLGLARFAALVRAAKLPIYALGGVEAARARELKAAGASGLAVVSAVFGSQDPAAAVAALLAAWRDA
jgi:thiamine-phosphate pyrophosphorylase